MELESGKIFTFCFRGRENGVSGIVLSWDSKWIMLIYIPVDYSLDGFMLINRKHVKGFWRKDEEIFKEAVLKSKNVRFRNYRDRYLDNFISYFYKSKKLIQVELSDDRISYVGRALDFTNDSFVLKKITTRGVWDKETKFKISSVYTFQFDNDYLTALSAYSKTHK